MTILSGTPWKNAVIPALLFSPLVIWDFNLCFQEQRLPNSFLSYSNREPKMLMVRVQTWEAVYMNLKGEEEEVMVTESGRVRVRRREVSVWLLQVDHQDYSFKNQSIQQDKVRVHTVAFKGTFVCFKSSSPCTEVAFLQNPQSLTQLQPNLPTHTDLQKHLRNTIVTHISWD